MKHKIQYLFFFVFLLFLASCSHKKEQYNAVGKTDTTAIFISSKVISDSLFVGDQACKKCHKQEYKNWKGSFHDKAMQIASDSSVLGNFDNQRFTSQKVTSHFYKKDGNYYVNTQGPDGEYYDYKIEYTFGVKPLQQYIVKFPNGRYQCLNTAWDSQKNKWFSLYPDFKVVHSDWLHWTKGAMNWNNMCADCHSTNVRKNYNTSTDSYHTQYSLINVSCEACHGPGKEHISQVTKLAGQYKKSTSNLKMTTGMPSKKIVDECARCHMRREQISTNYNYKGTLLDHYYPNLIMQNTYYPDGQILDEDYVYGSFIQSKMYHNGVSCVNCHNPHSTSIKFEGNKLCMQCHEPAKFNVPSHYKHLSNSEGAKCVNCHMPGKFYMKNDFRRDHSLRIPRPDLSIAYGTPNACTQCHTDKDNKWALENYKKMFGEPKKNHFSDLLAPGLTGKPNGLNSLLTLAKDTAYPVMARASAINGMKPYLNAQVVNQLLSFLKDDSSLVKAASLDVLGQIDNKDYFSYFLPLLKDKKRAVRIKAFFAIGGLDELQVPKEYQEAYKKVKAEFNANINQNADFVGGRMKKADYYLKKGKLSLAISEYEKALKIDNLNNIARTNLANLYYRNGDMVKAEEAFKTIIKQEPAYGETYYSYALLLSELNRTNEAIAQIKKAIQYMPDNIRLYYNLGLMYTKVNNYAQAKITVKKGLEKSPQNGDLLYILAYTYFKNKEYENAKKTAEKLVQLYPNNQSYINFYNQLKGNR
ncbi:tetratricopeptide repeat protein [Tenacibaculum sp. UWU-22]|uniref:tetratricopeptide repeat protein n=1 Tax=Tenacibaculum sp. UWU-22 TaxID=3234187 RepID=UPI0034DAC08D